MKYIYDMILMSISSAVMYIAAQLLHRNARSKYARWYYAMLVTAELMLIVPIQTVLKIPKLMRITVPQTIGTAADENISFGFTASRLIIAVWVSAAVIMGVFTAVRYFKNRKILMNISDKAVSDEILSAYKHTSKRMNIRRNIEIRTSEYLNSPLLFGIINPTVIVPKRAFTQNELTMIMAHELTHYKHRDLIIKLIAAVGCCVWWFNPAAYFLAGTLNKACELCCDESVLETLAPEDKKEYGRLILSVIEANSVSKLAYTTAMAQSEHDVKKRLKGIINFKRPSLQMRIICTMLLLSTAVCSVTAFGIETAKEFLPPQAVQLIEQIEDTPILPSPTAETVDDTPTPIPESTAKPYLTAPQKTYAPKNSEPQYTAAPAAVKTPLPTEPTSTVLPQAATETPSPQPRNTKPVDIVIDESINFDNDYIPDGKSRRVEVNADESEPISEGQKVKAYIKVNDDGTYDLVRTETE